MVDKTKKTILIVDDDPMYVDFLVAVLKDEYSISVAKNGFDAITAAMDCMPDLIILDVNMPDLSGYEVISALKHMSETKSIPVIFNSSLDSFDDTIKGLTFGAVDYFIKNSDPNEIKNRIKHQIK